MSNEPLMLLADPSIGSRANKGTERTKIGEALRLLRVLNDVKQNELANRLELSKSYLSEIERGHKVPSTEVVEAYASIFRVPVSSIWFFHEQIQNGPDVRAIERAKGVIADRVLNLLRVLEQRLDPS